MNKTDQNILVTKIEDSYHNGLLKHINNGWELDDEKISEQRKKSIINGKFFLIHKNFDKSFIVKMGIDPNNQLIKIFIDAKQVNGSDILAMSFSSKRRARITSLIKLETYKVENFLNEIAPIEIDSIKLYWSAFS